MCGKGEVELLADIFIDYHKNIFVTQYLLDFRSCCNDLSSLGARVVVLKGRQPILFRSFLQYSFLSDFCLALYSFYNF